MMQTKTPRFDSNKVINKAFLLFLMAAVNMTLLSAAAQGDPYNAYLMAHFTGESSNYGEQIYFATSTDGRHWTDLNNSQPVLTSNIGEGGVRDPAIIRSADGTKFWILATDLCIGCGTDWGTAQHNGSTSLVIWESSDLINWSEPWLVDVAGSITDAGCAWAPEAIYDEANGNYVVYWATISPLDGYDKARIYYATTTDFVNFSTPQMYINRPGSYGIIDTQILKVANSTYQYYRVSRDTYMGYDAVTVEGSNSIFGSWTEIGDIHDLVSSWSEGPILYKFNDADQWCLMVDVTAGGYLPLVSTNLSDMDTYSVLSSSQYDLGASRKRHGSILNITTAQLDALLEKWPPPTPPQPAEDISSLFVNLDFDSGDVTVNPFNGFDDSPDILNWTDYPTSPLNDAGVEGPGAWWGPYETNAGFMSTGDGAYNMSTYTIQSNDIFRIGFQAQWWDWTGAAGEWIATLFYDDPANVIGTFVQSGLTSSWTVYSDTTFIPATPASVGGTLGILLQSTGGGIAQIDEITIEKVHILNDSPAEGSTGISPIRTNADNDLVFTVYDPSLGANDIEVYMTAGDPTAPDLIATITAPGTGQLRVNLESLSTDLANETTYYWKAVGYEPNAVPTTHLDPVSGPVWSFETLPATPPPAEPTSLTAVSGIGSVSLDWNDNIESDLSGYNVYRSQTQDGPYTLIQNVILSQYVDGSVSNGTKYYYVVTAENTSANESGYSNEDSALPPDLTDDDKIDLADLAQVAQTWLTTYDINDMAIIAENWLID